MTKIAWWAVLVLAIPLAGCAPRPMAPVGSAEAARLAEDVEVRRIAPGVWMHVTTADFQGTPVAANGLVVEEADGTATLVDTGWDDAQAARLLAWARETLRRPVARAVVTHWHDDRLGGVAALRRAGVPVHGLARTRERALAAKVEAPDALPGLGAETPARVGGVELFFPGPGHTDDNVVVWIPAARLLFGGCLVKDAAATGLGFTGDADLARWPASVARVEARYPAAAFVVPGHGDPGSGALLVHTRALLEARARGE